MIITFQPLQEVHFPLLLKWLETPHVKDWWDQDVRWTHELVKEKFGSYVQGYKVKQGLNKPMQPYIISIYNVPTGYIQLYNAHDFPREDNIPLTGLPNSLAALDIFIGEEEYVDPSYDACFVDPDTANIKAIRAYEKAGFKKIKTLKEGTITWMVREKIIIKR